MRSITYPTVQTWEYDGHGSERGRLLREISVDLMQALKDQGCAVDEYLAYNWSDLGRDARFPMEYHWISCFAVTGGSEGHYVHIEYIKEDKRVNLFLLKTFRGIDYALGLVRMLTIVLGA